MRSFQSILLALISISTLASATEKKSDDQQSTFLIQKVEQQQAEIVSLNEIIQALTEGCDSGDTQTKWEIKKLEAQRNSLLDQLLSATNKNQVFASQLSKGISEKTSVSINNNNKPTAVWEKSQTVESLNKTIQMLMELDPNSEAPEIQWEIQKYTIQRNSRLKLVSSANDEALAHQLSEGMEEKFTVWEEPQTVTSINENETIADVFQRLLLSSKK